MYSPRGGGNERLSPRQFSGILTLVSVPDAAAAVVLFTTPYFVILPHLPPTLTSSKPILEDSSMAL